MPFLTEAAAREIPWRPGYRSFVLAGKDHGMSCTSSLGVLEPGAGAPLHLHTGTDEIIMVLDGAIDFRLGDERRTVAKGDVVAIPAGTSHGFTVIGPDEARILVFIQQTGAFGTTKYLEGGPPLGADQK